MMGKKIKILDLSFDVALKNIKFVKYLKLKKEFVLLNQLLRSVISAGVNVPEVQTVQSTKDFISKLSIASKEARDEKFKMKKFLTCKFQSNQLPTKN